MEALDINIQAFIESTTSDITLNGTSKSTNGESGESEPIVNDVELNGEGNEQEDGAENIFMCVVCDETFQKESSLDLHMTAHSGSKTCVVCGKDFAKLSVLKRHLFAHTGEKPHKCEFCGRAFSNIRLLKRHTNNIHNRKREEFYDVPKDTLNNRKSDEFDDLPKVHFGAPSKDGEEKQPSESDSGSIRMSTTPRKRHRIRVAPNEKPFKCEICTKAFLNKSTLKAHVAIHNGNSPYKCNYCQKGFVNSSHLKYHLSTHTGEKAYACGVCGKTFSQSSNLKTHIRTHKAEELG